jgi:hypothetical protein
MPPVAKPTVYIETTIAGHLASRLPKDPVVAGQMLATRKWWKDSRKHFELFSSEVMLIEASKGDPQAAAERLDAVLDLALVPVTERAFDLVDLLLSRKVLPAIARVDALHVAVAATNQLQYLLTWNCKHIANATLRGKIDATCRELGYNPPVICTPDELKAVSP